MTPEPTSSSVAIHALFDLLIEHGFSTEAVEDATGINRVKMDDPHARIPMTQFLRLWKIAIEWTNNPGLPLTLRAEDSPERMHLVAHIGMSSKTLKEAVEKWIDYSRLVCETDRITLREEENYSALIYENTSPAHQTIWIPEHHLAVAFRYGELFSGIDQPPIEVRFQHPPTDYPEVYQQVFRCPVLFNQDENALILVKGILSTKIHTTNSYLKAILNRHAEFLLKQLYSEESISQRVKNTIVRNLAENKLDAVSVASKMNMHQRTLYRKLKQHGTSFKALLDEVRKDFSMNYLEQGLSVNEITFLLGFSEPSAFQHAFKRWFGKSPGKFRRRPPRV